MLFRSKLLFDRQFLEKKKKQIFSTTMGKALIDLLSESAAALVEPDLTALWEQKMSQIDRGELQLEFFIQEVARMIGEMVQKPLAVPEIEGLKRRARCLAEGCSGYLRRIKGKNGLFLACPVCKATFSQGSDGNLHSEHFWDRRSCNISVHQRCFFSFFCRNSG